MFHSFNKFNSCSIQVILTITLKNASTRCLVWTETANDQTMTTESKSNMQKKNLKENKKQLEPSKKISTVWGETTSN